MVPLTVGTIAGTAAIHSLCLGLVSDHTYRTPAPQQKSNLFCLCCSSIGVFIACPQNSHPRSVILANHPDKIHDEALKADSEQRFNDLKTSRSSQSICLHKQILAPRPACLCRCNTASIVAQLTHHRSSSAVYDAILNDDERWVYDRLGESFFQRPNHLETVGNFAAMAFHHLPVRDDWFVPHPRHMPTPKAVCWHMLTERFVVSCGWLWCAGVRYSSVDILRIWRECDSNSCKSLRHCELSSRLSFLAGV